MLDDLSILKDDDAFAASPTVIKIIGCGGGGSSSVRRMIEAGVENVQFIALNTDLQALHRNPAPKRIAIGQKLTGGLGAGGNPAIGEAAAEEDVESIQNIVQGANMVVITAGMGGGTGTGSAPIVAKIAKESGALTVAVVTTPFAFEGQVRMRNALEGIEKLRQNVDSLIVIPNEQVYHMDGRKPKNMREAYIIADEVVCNGIKGITEMITKECQPNLDFADVRSIMKNQGETLLGVGYGEGENRAVDAAISAISNPMLADCQIDGATKILLNVVCGTDDNCINPDELRDMINNICASASKNLEFIYGVIEDPERTNDGISVTVIATGFSKDSGFIDDYTENETVVNKKEQNVVSLSDFDNLMNGNESSAKARDNEITENYTFPRFSMVTGEPKDTEPENIPEEEPVQNSMQEQFQSQFQNTTPPQPQTEGNFEAYRPRSNYNRIYDKNADSRDFSKPALGRKIVLSDDD